jgi:ABC-type multidrug transport system ATPase subunit
MEMIKLEKVRKRFEHEWVIKDLTYTFENNKAYAILGPNGSGKSTLMQLVSGAVTPSAGSILYTLNGKSTPVEEVFRQVSFSGPYIQLVEEMTLMEHIQFHQQFTPIEGSHQYFGSVGRLLFLYQLLYFGYAIFAGSKCNYSFVTLNALRLNFR